MNFKSKYNTSKKLVTITLVDILWELSYEIYVGGEINFHEKLFEGINSY